MQILFAISILCFLGVVWAAIGFARHIQASRYHGKANTAPRPDFKQVYLSVPENLPEPNRAISRIRTAVLHQSVGDITAGKQWSLPPQSGRPNRPVASKAAPAKPEVPDRKPPQPARHGPLSLIDPAYFNKDMGDLTDPYEPNRIHAGEQEKRHSSRHY